MKEQLNEPDYHLKFNVLLIFCLFSFSGTSIGFKNIASKIAYDLRLWLDFKTEPSHSQQSKSLDNEHTDYNIDEDLTKESEEQCENVLDDQSSSTANSSKTKNTRSSSSKSTSNRNTNNKKLGYNNIIASLLRTTTL